MVSIDTPATGNCLFEAIIQLVNQFTNNNDLTATELRDLSVEDWQSKIDTVDTLLAQLPTFESLGYQVVSKNISEQDFLDKNNYEYLKKEIGQKTLSDKNINNIEDLYNYFNNHKNNYESLGNENDFTSNKQQISQIMQENGYWLGQEIMLSISEVIQNYGIRGFIVIDSKHGYPTLYPEPIGDTDNYICVVRENENHYSSVLINNSDYFINMNLRNIFFNNKPLFPIFKNEKINPLLLKEEYKDIYPYKANNPCDFYKLQLKEETDKDFCNTSAGWLPSLNERSTLDYSVFAIYINPELRAILQGTSVNTLLDYTKLYWVSNETKNKMSIYQSCKTQFLHLIINEILISDKNIINSYGLENYYNILNYFPLEIYLNYIQKITNKEINFKIFEINNVTTDIIQNNQSIIFIQITGFFPKLATLSKTKCSNDSFEFLFLEDSKVSEKNINENFINNLKQKYSNYYTVNTKQAEAQAQAPQQAEAEVVVQQLQRTQQQPQKQPQKQPQQQARQQAQTPAPPQAPPQAQKPAPLQGKVKQGKKNKRR
jgi:hypothetical protein